ncbi:hypothetical protein HDU96_008940 [Phlyctochytrium bullatum]|nr:hypothetical protein HDU96_008940 [Phlyctochytrium bullatum]
MVSYNEVILVTGGARGIGAAAAIQLAKPGTAIVITYNSSKSQADATLGQLKAKGAEAAAVQANLATTEGAKKAVKETVERFGKITALINNAGVYDVAPIETVTEDLFDKVFDNNVKSVVLVTSAAVPNLADGASIVNVSSIITRNPLPNNTVYAASKGAIETFTRACAAELAPRQIRVNTVSPGFTATDMLPGAYHDFAKGLTPFGRVGTAEEVASVIAFFASKQSAWVSGQNVNASGGIGYSL